MSEDAHASLVRSLRREMSGTLAWQGGTNYEAAMRRAALMNTDDEEDSDADGDDARSEPPEDILENIDIDALSDEEAKEELREAQQRRLMEESQVCSSLPPCVSLARPYPTLFLSFFHHTLGVVFDALP